MPNHKKQPPIHWMLLCFYLSLSIACATVNKEMTAITGEWTVNSQFYKANCRIVVEDNTLNALVLYYNDGTTKYNHTDNNPPYYLFKDLKYADGQYIDGVSGATSKKNIPHDDITIELLGNDTLKMTTYIRQQSLIEIWTRL